MILFLQLLAVSILIYGCSVFGELVYDDMDSTLNQVAIRSGQWPEILKSHWIGHWRKLTRVSFAWNVRCAGLQHPDQSMNDAGAHARILFSFHATNIVLHAVNGFILFAILRGLGVESAGASLGSLFFIVHPLCRDAVAYISSRGVLLSTMFGFGAIVAALHGYWPVAIPLLWLAFNCKEDAIAFSPAIAALLALKHEWAALAFLIGPLSLTIVYRTGFSRLMQTTEKTGGKLKAGTVPSAGLTVTGYGAIESRWVCFKTTFTESVLHYPAWIAGQTLCFDHDIEPSGDWRFGFALMLFSAWICSFFLFENFLFHAAWILITIAPFSVYAFTPLRDYLMDLRAYSTLAGMALLFAIADIPVEFKYGFLAVAAFFSLVRAADYQNPIAFWAGAVRDGAGGKVRVLTNLAAHYQHYGRDAEAKIWTQRALDLQPDLGPSMVNMAILEARSGNLAKAHELATRVTTIHPQYAMAWKILEELCNLMNDKIGAKQASIAYAKAGG